MRPIGSVDPWLAGRVTDRAEAILAPNPGWMTLDGTNSWLLLEPGAHEAILIDPGPLVPANLDRLVSAAAASDARIAQILLTHGHPDHSEGAAALHLSTGAPVRALDVRHRLGGEGLADGEAVVVGGLELRVVATPGHTSDSLSFVLGADHALLTGDTVLGRGTAVIAHPDGQLGPYLDTLDRLAEMAAALGTRWLLPGHGPALSQPHEVLAAYREHRRERLDLVRAARADGLTDPEAILDRAYPEVPSAVRPAALLSLMAQLEYLAALQ